IPSIVVAPFLKEESLGRRAPDPRGLRRRAQDRRPRDRGAVLLLARSAAAEVHVRLPVLLRRGSRTVPPLLAAPRRPPHGPATDLGRDSHVLPPGRHPPARLNPTRQRRRPMMHRHRRWALSSAETPEALAAMLTDRTWTLCSAF